MDTLTCWRNSALHPRQRAAWLDNPEPECSSAITVSYNVAAACSHKSRRALPRIADVQLLFR
jgi:hypothetical protein